MRIRYAALALAVALLISGCSLLPTEAELPPLQISTPVTTQREIVTLRRSSLAVQVELQGLFGSARQQSLYAQSGGRLKALHVQVGDRVQEGQLLAELEAGSLTFDLARAELNVQRRKLALSMVENRKDSLPAEQEMARLDLQEAELTLAQAREALAATQVVAPFAGTIISVTGTVGAELRPAQELLVLAGEGDLVMRAPVDPVTGAQLQVGQLARLYPNDGAQAPLLGRVAQVPPLGDGRTNGSVLIALDEPSPRARPLLSGRVEVVVQEKADVLLLPKSAIKLYGGREFVTVVKGESRQEVAIKTGLDNGVMVEVLEGLEAGAQVVGR
jgi:macrolide-specific efflux system membrane fusion protein